MLKSISLKMLLVILFVVAGQAYALDDNCNQLDNVSWQGSYGWTYRGDHYQKAMTANSIRLDAHHYNITMYIQDETTSPLKLTGTCMDSQIYLEDLSLQFPIYLQGTIVVNNIKLHGNRGPDVLDISLTR